VKRRHAFLVVIAVIVLLAGLVAGALGWLVASESGARFALARALAYTGDAVTVGDLSGSLRSRLVLSDIRYVASDAEIAIDRLEVDVALPALLARVLQVESLDASGVRYRSRVATPAAAPAPAPAPAATAPFRLPLSVHVERAGIADVAIERGDERFDIGPILLVGRAEGTGADVDQLEVDFDGFEFIVAGQVAWQDRLTLDGTVTFEGALGERGIRGESTVAGQWPRFDIEAGLTAPVTARVAGAVIASPSPAADLTVDWSGLGVIAVAGGFDPAAGVVRARVDAADLVPGELVAQWPGQVSLGGDVSVSLADGVTVASDDLHVEARVDALELAADFAGRFDVVRRTLSADRLALVLGANRVEMAGRVGESLDLTVDAALPALADLAAIAERDELSALGLPAGLVAHLDGAATANLRVSGTLTAPLVTGRVQLTDAELEGLPLSADIVFATPSRDVAAITLERADATLGSTHVVGGGRIGTGADPALELTLTATAETLTEIAALASSDTALALGVPAVAVPAVQGSGQLDLRLTGSRSRPDFAATLNLANLAVRDLAVTTAHVDVAAGLYEGGRARLGLAATADDWTASVTADGRIDGGALVGTLRTFDIDEDVLGSWRLQAATPFAIGPERIAITHACLGLESSGVCLDWQRESGVPDRLELSADAFELAALNPLLPSAVSLSGRLTLAARLDADGDRPTGSLSASGQTIGIGVAVSETESMTTVLQSVAVESTLDGFGLSVRADVASRADGRASLNMTTADLRDPDAPISGRFDIEWPDLAALSLLSPDIGEVGGTLSLSVDLSGTAVAPRMAGTAELGDGHVAVPEWGVLVDGISGRAVSPDGSTLEFEGRGFIEDREVQASGVTRLDPGAGWPTVLSLRGDRLPVARRPDATVFASPQFDVSINLPRIDVTGRVVVPEADISVEQLPSQAVTVSPDTVVHGRLESEPVRPLELMADVTVELGDAVHYAGANLSVDLGGTLRLNYQSGQSPTASGNVRLTGTYDAYGQNLDLERGELLFAGPLNDPALDVLAVRAIGQTRVGVRLTGTLLAPQASLYSDPAMSDLNALSYLRFGRPITASDDTETATLESTALALGLQQALPAVQRVGESLGLDEFSIAPNEIDAGALMAGKYLSPKLYMSYSYGLFNRLGGFLLRYQINDRFSLETRSGGEKSMDLLYSIEKD